MPTSSEAPRLDQSAQNAHRDIRRQLFQALDLVAAREVVAEADERGWLSMVRGQLNNAVCWTTDAERAANAAAASRSRSLLAERDALLAVVQELRESAKYWSEYDVPVGIVDRMDAAIAMATSESAEVQS